MEVFKQGPSHLPIWWYTYGHWKSRWFTDSSLILASSVDEKYIYFRFDAARKHPLKHCHLLILKMLKSFIHQWDKGHVPLPIARHATCNRSQVAGCCSFWCRVTCDLHKSQVVVRFDVARLIARPVVDSHSSRPKKQRLKIKKILIARLVADRKSRDT